MSLLAARLARRGLRGAWRHLVPFATCIALGVVALTAVGTFTSGVHRTLGREARTLAGGDVEVRASRPLGAEASAVVAELTARGARVTTVRELAAMARSPGTGRTLLVELKAVDGAYPLYGTLETAPGGRAAELLAGEGALVAAEVLERLGMRIGDALALGAARLTIRGVIAREPDRAAAAITLGPRVIVGAATLDHTGLVRVGSRVRYRTLLRLPPDLAPGATREELARRLSDPALRVVAFDEAQPGLRRFLDQLTTYLGLVGLVTLLVGGVGASAAAAALARRERAQVAVLKCLGVGWRTLVGATLLRTLGLALAASAAGAAAGIALAPLLPRLLTGLVPFAIDARPDAWTIVRALGMALLTALLAVLWPLLDVRRVPPSLILRRDVETDRLRRPRLPLAVLPLLAGLATLAVWQAGSIRLGAIFTVAAFAAVVVLALVARAVARLSRLAPRPPGLAWRHGIASLHRPGGETALVVVALGLGVMLLVAVGLLEASLDRQLDREHRRERPSFFFVDIQTDQRDAFARLLARLDAGRRPELIPLVRARLAGVKGEPVTRAMIDRRREGGQAPWYLTREYMLTAASSPPVSNTVVRGRWWTAEEAASAPRISVEDGLAERLGVGVGDRLTFDVQGMPVEAEVMSLRKVDWQTLSTNFFVIFSQGALDGAPTTYVATARVPPDAETSVQDAVVAAFPNVTPIPVGDVLARVSELLAHIGLAIRAVALLAVAAGAVVMVGALAATRYQRLYESVVLRALGATRGLVARAFAVEYACLGAAAGLGGTALAVLLAWVVLRFVLDVPWTFDPLPVLLGVVLATALALAVGFLTTFRLLGERPLTVLRRD